MSLNLGKAIINCLQTHPDQKFTAREIAEWVFEKFPEECQIKKQNSQFITTDSELLNQLVGEISAVCITLQKKYPALKTTESRPRHYYYTEKSDAAEITEIEKNAVIFLDNEKSKICEHNCILYFLHFLKKSLVCIPSELMKNVLQTSKVSMVIAGYIQI